MVKQRKTTQLKWNWWFNIVIESLVKKAEYMYFLYFRTNEIDFRMLLFGGTFMYTSKVLFSHQIHILRSALLQTKSFLPDLTFPGFVC